MTQICGSLTAQNVIEKACEIKEKKNAAEMKKGEKMASKRQQLENFLRCKDVCVCQEAKCVASGFKQCTSCHAVMKSNCSKMKCKSNDGQKPTMELVDYDKKVKGAKKSCKRIDFDSSEDDETSASDESDTDEPDQDTHDGKELTALDTKDVAVGDWVKVMYEEVFIGKVVQKAVASVQVKCLKHPYGIRIPQEMEGDNDDVFYQTVYSK